jgi:tetratricopeptide (TPR) repeat protein
MRRALEITEKSFGPEHPSVSIRLNNLAQLLKATNRLKEAEPLMRRALEINEKSFGPEHPDVAIDLNNLAQLLQATNRLKEAEPLMRHALEIAEKSFGPEHPTSDTFRSNLKLLEDKGQSQSDVSQSDGSSEVGILGKTGLRKWTRRLNRRSRRSRRFVLCSLRCLLFHGQTRKAGYGKSVSILVACHAVITRPTLARE